MKTTFGKKVNQLSKENDSFQVWKTIKTKYADTIVLVRTDEHYFTFGSDAVTVNKITSVEITFSGQNHYQCSFLFYRLDTVLSKLINAGPKVAVCDQL
jgi:DNA mismatch repair ATPase MutS